ncbi:MAG: ATP-binding protein [Phycisphaerales bacterium]|nr:ATP-binding protein [Phycisphaerales bacterium]MCI0675450.1 ATP-binding protein [Phycisphaerales bacterium]
MLVLHILQGPDRGKKFELPAHEPQLIGRSSEALPITDTTVSRRHAELTPDDGKWFLRDLQSANGTFINGTRITSERVQLGPGDQIRCGSTLLVFAITPDVKKSTVVSLLPSEAFDVSVESQMPASAESMILSAPDPIHAAAEHLRVIYELTALTATTFDRQELLEKVMDLIFIKFQADRGFILLQEKPTDRPDPVVVRYKVRPKTLDEGRIPVSRTIVQHTLERNEGILSTNAMNDSRFRSGDSVRDYGIRSAICVPIRAVDRTFGVIHIDSSLMNFTFTDQQLRLMNAIGQHTGLALQTAQALSGKMHTERLAAMGEAVASLSHSIKNIIQALRGGADAVELALNKGDLKLAKEGWPILARNLDRIYALTLNMLMYSKQRALEIDLSSINRLVQEAVELMQLQADRKRVGLILELDADMPPIPVDSNALHQAFMNLLINAIEAAPEKKGVVTIKSRFLAASREAQISVSDNGAGVDPQWREHIFEAFASTKGQRGTGLGLAVTRKIVEEHGGRVELAPADGKGATFIITLPSDRATEIDPSDTRLPRPLPAAQSEEEFS